MALLLASVAKFYKHIFYDLPDPRTQNMFLVGSPVAVPFICITYLILVNEVIPKLMKNRKPFDLKRVLIVYNVTQILLSGYIVVKGFKHMLELSVECGNINRGNDAKAQEIMFLFWMYMMIKFYDMFDTLFFLLRKKSSHVSFLHMYHHFGVTIVAWIGTKFVPGGASLWVGFINSFVHVIMYTYYLASSMKVVNTIWWKKYVTILQITQFLLLLLVYLPTLLHEDCDFPKGAIMLYYPQNVTILLLFIDFYYKTYIKRGNRQTCN